MRRRENHRARGLRAAFWTLAGLLCWTAVSSNAATFFVEKTGSDANPGTQGSPFLTVSRGLAAASAGDTVRVGTGTFREHLRMSTDNVALEGAGAGVTFLQGPQTKMFVDFEGGSAVVWVTTNTTGVAIRGFSIYDDYHGIFTDDGSLATIEYNRIEGNLLNGITVDGSSPTIRYNVFRGSAPYSPNKGWLYSYTAVDIWTPASPVIRNNTMVDLYRIGICTLRGATPVIRNNIIAKAPLGIATPDGSANLQTIEYNNVWDNGTNYDAVTGWRNGRIGNIAADPVFADAANGDFRLRSCSPSVDAGDPAPAYDDPDGTRGDMGAFYTEGGKNALLPPSTLSAAPLDGRRVKLTWERSPSSAAAQYNLYLAQGDHLTYASPAASLTAQTTFWISPALTAGLSYKFGLRTTDGVCEEANTTVTATAMPATTAPACSVFLKIPKNGKKISGNRVLVKAETEGCTPASVEFHYRFLDVSAPVWTAIPAANANHPNPDASAPFFVHWDVSSLSEGQYELRASTSALANTPVDGPPTIFVRVDHGAPDVAQNATAGGVGTAEVVHNGVDNRITLGEAGRNATAGLTLPAGALSDSSATVTISLTEASGLQAAAAGVQGLTSFGLFMEVTLSNGQTRLNVPALLSLGYADADGDGIVDGLGIDENSLEIRYFDPPTSAWKKVEGAQTIDASANTAAVQTPHFTVFGLFGSAAAANLDALRIYPVPFVPNDGNPDTGRAFASGDLNSGIVFKNVTADVAIDVYDVTGRRVWSAAGGSGADIRWDVRSGDGREVASGVYFAVVKGGGKTVTRKIAVVR